MRFIEVLFALLIIPAFGLAEEPKEHYPIRPVPFTKVRIEDSFWKPRLETNRKVTVPFDFRKCEETGRIDNFAKAGGLMEGKFEGIRFNDSDVFKVVEGAAYSLSLHPDPELDRYLDGLIAKFAAAQEEDGYLFTTRTIDPKHPAPASGETRWSYLRHSHELYNVGHMYEAAVAHFRATGKRAFLDVALRNADLICEVFGPDGIKDVPGHQEIEIGLVKLYLVTGERKYLDQAAFFLDMRGRADQRELYGEYCQDHVPVKRQASPVGHAVRAGYMYSGMADVAALTGNEGYIAALDRIWESVAFRKLYLTGGVGARHGGESFGDDYELPNASAYNETCAAIANAMWNHRLFLLHGDAKYLDVLERILYNGFLVGVSLEGDRFFYVNPLSSDGRYKFNHGSGTRQPWFGCSCCPTNVVRFLPSLAGYIYAVKDDVLYVNLFVRGGADVKMGEETVRLEQETRYPWDGNVKIRVYPHAPDEFTILVRIPGWARNRPVPGDLYSYLFESGAKVSLKVNGEEAEPSMEKGFARFQRRWSKGDVIEIDLPMPVRRVIGHAEVKDIEGMVALERGPIVFCAEGIDNEGKIRHLMLPDDAKIRCEFRKDLLGGVCVLSGRAVALSRNADGSLSGKEHDLLAVPYHVWSHRGEGEMTVWLPRVESAARPLPFPTLASRSRVSASLCWKHDSVRAVNDQDEPKSSGDHSISRFTWWDHRGTKEWIQYDFGSKIEISSVEVYWFDDTGRGACRVPMSWRLLYGSGEQWIPVESKGAYTVERDQYNGVEFEPVVTDRIRLEADLQSGFSAGILEWRVE